MQNATFDRLRWVLLVLVLLSPLFVMVPFPYPRVTGPAYLARLCIFLMLLRSWRDFPLSSRPLFLLLMAVAGITLLTSVLGMDPKLSLGSTPNRMTGAVDQLHWMMLSAMLPVVIAGRWQTALAITCGTALVMALTAIAGIGPCGNRACGMAANPGFLAVFMVGAIPASIYMGRQRWAWYLVALACVVALWMSGTRAGFLGMGAALAVLSIRSDGLTRIASILAVGVLGVLLLIPNGTSERTFGTNADETSVVERWEFAQTGIRLALSSPIYGHGPNAVDYAPERPELLADYPHNIVIQEMAEKGLLGLFSLALVLYAAFVLWRAKDGLSMLFLAILSGIALYALFWFLSWHMALWLALVIGYALGKEKGHPS